MITYALDTNIVSYFLKGNAVITRKIQEEKSRRNKFVIPPMVYFETQFWLTKNKSIKKMEIFRRMYVKQGIGILDKDVFDIAVTEKLGAIFSKLVLKNDRIYLYYGYRIYLWRSFVCL